MEKLAAALHLVRTQLQRLHIGLLLNVACICLLFDHLSIEAKTDCWGVFSIEL